MGLVVEVIGPLNYETRNDAGIILRRHADQISNTGQNMPTAITDNSPPPLATEDSNDVTQSTPAPPDVTQSNNNNPIISKNMACVQPHEETAPVRKSTRNRHNTQLYGARIPWDSIRK